MVTVKCLIFSRHHADDMYLFSLVLTQIHAKWVLVYQFFKIKTTEHYKVYLTFPMPTASKWQVHIWLILKSSFSPAWNIVSLSIIKWNLLIGIKLEYDIGKHGKAFGIHWLGLNLRTLFLMSLSLCFLVEMKYLTL